MALIYDLIEVTGISPDTTYSTAQGNLVGVVNSAQLLDHGKDDTDGEFDTGDQLRIGGVSYRIDQIQKPSSSGRFTLGDGSERSFNPASESNLAVIFLTVSNGGTVRRFIIPNDSYGGISIREIRTGSLTNVGGSDAAVISTASSGIKIVCFAAGSLIEVAGHAQVAVESLSAGDWVQTADHGLMQIRWVGSMTLDRQALAAHPHLRPIRISKDALGPGSPAQDLYLSPQHRVLVKSRIALRMFGAAEVLVAVRHLVGSGGIDVVQDTCRVVYHHVLLDRHEILFANGAACESLYLGAQAIGAVGRDVLDHVDARQTRVGEACIYSPACRPLASGRKGHALGRRHRAKQLALFEPAPIPARMIMPARSGLHDTFA
ncbi:Hint domain-containing protein [Pseudotabrizicola sp. 4114]|uniref:Hint domain-containing protein n=1 Tax=Pseudotabrizicola sp. 4114 TaxID=2817731 RepID=UPI002862925A|nr:hypothetical protein [Pseudorhodobacter sp. 4114]